MDIYLTSLGIGVVGLAAMAASGIGQHGGHGAHGAHAHGGDGHAGHGGSAHVGHAHGAHAHGTDAHADHTSAHTNGPMWLSLMSPRLWFSVCLGLGTTGMVLRHTLDGVPLFAVALLGGIAFERVLVGPLWNALFRFASNPALTLESAVMGEANAVTNFDANGQGLIAIEMDGQVVQLLGTLQAVDRAMAICITAGTRLRVESVDAARNRCTVSLR